MGVENVTAKVAARIRDSMTARPTTPARRPDATRAGPASRRASTRKSGPLSANPSTFYQGGQYWLYKYHRYDDVRLVFAPERGICRIRR